MDSDGEGHVQEESAGDEVMKPDLLHDPELDEPSGNEIVPRETFGWRAKSACRLFLYNVLRQSE